MSDRLERAAQHAIRARLFLDLWFYFEGADTRPKIIDTMRDYNEYFRFVPHAYFTTYIVHIAGLFENKRDTINVNLLLKDTLSQSKITKNDHKNIIFLIEKSKQTIKKVKILRDNAFAHKTDRESYNDVFLSAKVSKDELFELSDRSLEIINTLSDGCGARHHYFTNLPLLAAELMMATLGRRHPTP